MATETKENVKNHQIERDFKIFDFPQYMTKRDFSDLPKKEKIWESDPEQVKLSYQKLVEMWNKDGKARGFVKHLVASFLPYNNFARLLSVGEEKIKCAILNHELMGISDISHYLGGFSVQKMFVDAKCCTEKRTEYNEDEIKRISDEKAKMPEAALNSRVAIGSDKSDKFLMVESNIGLSLFAQDMLMTDNKEFEFLMKKMRISSYNNSQPKEKQLTPKEVNLVSKATSFGVKSHMKDSAFSALEKLKASLEDKEKSQ